jgi:RNA polymerase sigma-70 factor (ECF subfamily)
VTEDIEAIDAVKNGDKDRYGELVARYERMVYGIAWSQLGDADLCEEAAQETFVRAYRYLIALKDPERFPGWLARIARNVSTSVLRKNIRELKKRERWLLEPAHPEGLRQCPEDEPTLTNTLREMLAELPILHRECLVLFYLEGKNIREAAGVLGISESAMKTRLHRARVELRGRMEERLEESLVQLSPRKNLSAIIFPLLPAMPLGAGLGASTAAAKALSGLGLLNSMGILFVMSIPQGFILAANLGWYAKLETENIADGTGKAMRKRIIYRTFTLMGVVALMAIVSSQWTSMLFGPTVLFQMLAPLTVFGLWRTGRALRVNDTAFSWGQFVTSATFLVLFLLIGFCGAPYWTFLAGLLPLNIVLYYTNKSKPSRQDYNLFLRQATGTLGQPDTVPGGRTPCTRHQLKAFMRFLGSHFLAADYGFSGDGIRLWLPPVAPGARMFLGFSDSTSSVYISADGTATACLGRNDRRLLRKFTGDTAVDGARLEERVADVVSAALRHFLNGDTTKAEALLQPEKDADIFVKPLGESRAYRIQGGLAIGGAILILILFAALEREHTSTHRAVALSETAKALLRWSGSPRTDGNFCHVMQAAEQPPPGFFGADYPVVYREAVYEHLRERPQNNPMLSIAQSADFARALYHALRYEILSREQRSALGFTPEAARTKLEGMNRAAYLDQITVGVLPAPAPRPWGLAAPDLEYMAYCVASLDKLGCLDQFDTRLLSKQLAAHQVTSDWKRPEGYALIERNRALGLFNFGYCNLRNTRAALWTLQLIGGLDTIDREACIEGILRFHRGKGEFRADFAVDPAIQLRGEPEDMYYALESLNILGALDRIPDLSSWQYRPVTEVREVNGKKEHGVLTGKAVVYWAYQLRLQELRGY